MPRRPGVTPSSALRAIAGDKVSFQIAYLHQSGHRFGIRFAQIRAISNQPQFVLGSLDQVLDGHLPQLRRQMLGIHLRALVLSPLVKRRTR